MRHVALTLVAPVRPDAREGLQAALDALPSGPASPLAGIPGLHLGRIAVVDALRGPQGEPMPGVGPLLMVSLDADGPLDAVLAALAIHCGELLRACEGCPDPADGPSFAAWARAHRLKDRWTIMPYAGRTLPEVRSALRTRERLGAFAGAVADADPATLRARFLEQFGDA
ncbi:MAG: hypothetical protein JWM31_1703 [Solirubrobacterales bacterium]|nr:hypothetical protein [Solirubrobacterales bacterium]